MCMKSSHCTLLKRWEYQTTWLASWEICMQVKKQQLELDIEKQTGSKWGMEYVRAIYCHPAYSTSTQSEVKWSEVTQSCPTLCDPWTVAYQAPLSTGFSRQGFWSGLPLPSPGDLPNPGTKPGSPALQANALSLRRVNDVKSWAG